MARSCLFSLLIFYSFAIHLFQGTIEFSLFTQTNRTMTAKRYTPGLEVLCLYWLYDIAEVEVQCSSRHFGPVDCKVQCSRNQNFQYRTLVTNVRIEPIGHDQVWALVDHPLQLECIAEGWIDGEPKPEWRKNGVLIHHTMSSHSPQFSVQHEIHDGYIKSILSTDNVSMLDTGYYTCAAGSLEEFVQVTVFSVVYKDVNITVAFETLLEVEIETSYADRMTTWYKDGVPLLEVEDLKDRISIGADNQSVSIDDTKASDGGIYTALIEFKPGKHDKQSFEINITALGPPYIKGAETPDVLQKVDNTSILLKCPAGGQPPPKVIWFRNKEVLEPGDRLALVELDGVDSGLLEITNTTADDLGEYTCTAENYRGKATVTFKVSDPYAGSTANFGGPSCFVVVLMLSIVSGSLRSFQF